MEFVERSKAKLRNCNIFFLFPAVGMLRLNAVAGPKTRRGKHDFWRQKFEIKSGIESFSKANSGTSIIRSVPKGGFSGLWCNSSDAKGSKDLNQIDRTCSQSQVKPSATITTLPYYPTLFIKHVGF